MINKQKLIAVIILLNTGFLVAQQADDLLGTYRLSNDLEIEIFKAGDQYNGKIVALNGYKNGETRDVNNPDKTKRNDLLIGKVIIEGLEFDEQDKEWIDATIYGPEKGMLANLRVTEVDDNEIKVVASKYFFWRTLKWKKTE